MSGETRAARWVGIPLREDGRERMGTEGTLSGDYRSLATFERYRLRPYGPRWAAAYNVYTVRDGRWTLQAERMPV